MTTATTPAWPTVLLAHELPDETSHVVGVAAAVTATPEYKRKDRYPAGAEFNGLTTTHVVRLILQTPPQVNRMEKTAFNPEVP